MFVTSEVNSLKVEYCKILGIKEKRVKLSCLLWKS